MDDDTFPNSSNIDAKKTYMKRSKKRILGCTTDTEDVEKIVPLTPKIAVKFLLEGKLQSKVCRYCLNITPGLSELDQIMQIAGTGNLYKVTIRDIVASFHPFKVADDPNFPNKICQKCLDRALEAYLFTQQCERAERAMLNCFDDMYEKLEKLDPIDRPKKRGRQKLNPNYNTLYAEHAKVIDYAEPIINIINVGSETGTTEPELSELECKKCWQILPNMESLLNHEKTHPKTMWYHCRICGKSFPKRNQLKKHNHRVHVLGKEVYPQYNKDFKCDHCSHVTDNYIQHLQHIEKHKFRNILEHIVEKRTDQLCVICFNSGMKMVELDQMVCIHGGHPDVMGDKNLYTILASTLPEKQSYKYQELCIPSKAQIMTISKHTSQSIKNISPPTKEDYIYSHPVIITKNRLKTDHFYFYVFCEPEFHKNNTDVNGYKIDEICPETQVINMVDDNDVSNVNLTTNDQVKDIKNDELSLNTTNKVDEYVEIPIDKSIKKAKIANTNIGIKNIDSAVKKSCTTKIISDINKTREETAAGDKNDFLKNNEFMENIPHTFNFSNPVILNTGILDTEIIKNDTKDTDIYKGSTADVENKEYEYDLNDKIANIDSKILKEKDWTFKNTDTRKCQPYDNTTKENYHNKSNSNCKFCWIFKHISVCEFCKIPNNGNQLETYKPNTQKGTDKTWQCNACLTNNNTDRLTCHCCGNTKTVEYNRLTFDNKTFFQETQTEIQDATELVPNNIKEIAIEEEIMNYKPTDIKPTLNINVQTMDVEHNIAQINDEQMDVEETPIITHEDLNWNPIFNFNTVKPINIGSNVVTNICEVGNMGTNIYNTVNPADNIGSNFATNICDIGNMETNTNNTVNPVPNIGSNFVTNVCESNMGTNINFSIGIAADAKPARKYKRAIRNIPKASHK